MTEVRIVTPPGMFGTSSSDELIDTAMRIIAVAFGDENEWPSKYGTNYENDTFMMHRYCWCEKPECLWCTIWLSNEIDCTETEAMAHRSKQEDEIRQRYGDWAAAYPQAPHFWYKPTGLQIRWYKYIGRDMESNGKDLPGSFLNKVFSGHPKGMTVDRAIEEMATREERSEKAFLEMLASLNIAQ